MKKTNILQDISECIKEWELFVEDKNQELKRLEGNISLLHSAAPLDNTHLPLFTI